MNLDTGILTVFRVENGNRMTGGKPVRTYAPIYRSWYGELNFETSPSRPTEGREELRIDARVRVHQYRMIRQHDVVVLRALDEMADREETDTVYRIARAYHGTDPESGFPITDLSLEEYQP